MSLWTKLALDREGEALTKGKKLLLGSSILAAVLVAAYVCYGVKVDVSLSRAEAVTCDPDHPIKVTVHNYTFRRLVRLQMRLEGWRDGNSDNILKNDWYRFTTVLQPFSSGVECFRDDAFSFPLSPDEKDASGNVKYDFSQVISRVNKLDKRTHGVVMVVSKFLPEFY